MIEVIKIFVLNNDFIQKINKINELFYQLQQIANIFFYKNRSKISLMKNNNLKWVKQFMEKKKNH